MEKIGWEQFESLTGKMAMNIRNEYEPDIIVGVAKAGVIPGALISSLFRKDFYTIKISRRKDDRVVHARPILFVPINDSVYGRKVLIVDAVSNTGETLRIAREEVEMKQAKEVKTCAIFIKPDSPRPDWFAHESREEILCPWNKFAMENGKLIDHPEYTGV